MFLIAVDKLIPSFLFETIDKQKLLIRFYSPPIQLRFKLLFLLCAIPREKKWRIRKSTMSNVAIKFPSTVFIRNSNTTHYNGTTLLLSQKGKVNEVY